MLLDFTTAGKSGGEAVLFTNYNSILSVGWSENSSGKQRTTLDEPLANQCLSMPSYFTVFTSELTLQKLGLYYEEVKPTIHLDYSKNEATLHSPNARLWPMLKERTVFTFDIISGLLTYPIAVESWLIGYRCVHGRSVASKRKPRERHCRGLCGLR